IDKRFGEANLVVSSIESNPIGQSHSIPNVCKALLVRQIFENEDPAQIKNEFLNILRKNNYKEEDVSIKLTRFFKPLIVDTNTEIVSLLQDAKQLAIGKPSKIGQWTSGVNISEIFDVNMPIVGLGPGDEQFAHTPKEHVPIDQILQATKIYTVLAEKICVQMKDKSAT
ncbi:MAG: M20/M25/M40 family metallo-hydrolase, partial [Candidatus Thorarchaeota archaeon]